MNVALILAGGFGLRMGGDRPKQFLESSGTPIILHTLRNFTACDEIDRIAVVCPAQYLDYTSELLSNENNVKLAGVVTGGSTRRESSENGVNALKNLCGPDDIVLIHDGVRPNVNSTIISENIRLARTFGACETAFPSTDTVAVSEDGVFVSYVPQRSKLWNVQTPQSFRYSVIEKAHSYCSGLLSENPDAFPVTDDAGLVLKCISDGIFDDSVKVAIAMGSETNIKITRPSDMVIIEKLMEKDN